MLRVLPPPALPGMLPIADEDNPVDEGTTKGALTPLCIVQKNQQVPHTALQEACHPVSTRGLRPPEQLERPEGFPSSDKTRPEYPIPTLQARFDLSQQWRGNLRFLPQPEMRPSSIKTNPVESRAHSSVLAWRIPRTEEPGRLLSLGSHRVRHD